MGEYCEKIIKFYVIILIWEGHMNYLGLRPTRQVIG